MIQTAHGTNRGAFGPGDWALFISLSLIWGSSFLFMAIGLDAFHPGLVSGVRVGSGAVVLALVPQARARSIDKIDLGRVMFLGFLYVALPLTLFPIAQQWIDSAVAGMLNGATPVFTALLATLLLKTPPGRLQVVGLILGFAGMIAISLPSVGTGATAAIGVLLVVLATVCYAVSINMLPPLTQRYGSLAVMARAVWVGAVMTMPFGVYGLTESSFAWPSLFATLAVGLLGTGLAFVLMGALAGRVGATRAAFITYLIPVVALFLGVAFRDEVIHPLAIVGVILVIGGAFLASRREVGSMSP